MEQEERLLLWKKIKEIQPYERFNFIENIHRTQTGIYKEGNTAIAIKSISNSKYNDRKKQNLFFYKYPNTKRNNRIDQEEINSVKECQKKYYLFVIMDKYICMGKVMGWDDEKEVFKIKLSKDGVYF